MNRNMFPSVLIGLLLILLGVAGLLFNFGVLDAYKTLIAYVMAGLLAIAGAAFLATLVLQRDRWLYVIPGISFLSLGAIVYLSTVQTVKSVWLGALFLGGIAVGFLVLFLSNRQERWWALLQAGTIGVIAAVGLGLGVPEESRHLLGAALFGGFAISFLLLFLLGGNPNRFVWALIMAAVLAVFAVTLLSAGYGDQNIIFQLWPILLILPGLFLLVRAPGRRLAPQPAAPIQPAPNQRQAAPLPPIETTPGPARIVRPDQSAPAPQASPSNLPAFDPDDPSASLDALLEASKQVEDL